MRKGQTAMEYLMTYGWAILIIMVVLAVIFYLGVLNPAGLTPTQCIFPPGFTCVTNKLTATTAKLYLLIGQGTGHPIMVTGINCTQNESTDFAMNGLIDYAGDGNVSIASGSSAILSTSDDPSRPWLNITCTLANGSDPIDTLIGSLYNGKIYVKYQELDTGMSKSVLGSYTAKYEA